MSQEIIELLTSTADVLEAYKVAVDQLIEDLAFQSGTPRDILMVRYLGPVLDVIKGR